MQKEKVTYPIIKKYRPFLICEECRFCHKEFRKENGFVIRDFKKCRTSNEHPIYISYCCKKCASSINEVKLKIENENIIKKLTNTKSPRSRIKENDKGTKIFENNTLIISKKNGEITREDIKF